MKTSVFLTVASLICLLLPQANARVVNIKETKDEAHIAVSNESLRLITGDNVSEEVLKTFGGMGIAAALAANEREFRALPTMTSTSDCTMLKELEESKCEIKERKMPLFNEKQNYLVCTVAWVFNCTTPPPAKPLDFQF